MTTVSETTQPMTCGSPSSRPGPVDVWPLLTATAGTAALVEVVGPLNDPDIWWHVRTGRLMLDTGHVPHHEPWAFGAIGRPWVPNAWLSDLLLGIGYRVGGWAVVTLMFLFASGLVLFLLGRSLHREHSGPVAFTVFALTTASVLIFLAERPQVVSLAFCVWLVSLCRRLMRAESVNRWGALALVYLWANLHGMWVLAPLCITLAFIGALAQDRRAAWARRAEVAVMVVGSFVVAALTPVGPKLAYWWLVVRRAASGVSEWQPTVPWNHQAVWWVALTSIILASWAFVAERPPRGEAVWVFGIVGLGLSAGRNIAPASILLAPFAADALQRSVGARYGPRLWPQIRPWTIALPVAIGAVGLVTLTFAVPRLPSDTPTATVRLLRSQPSSQVRVLNDFNIGGFLTGMGAPKVSVTLDGRIDNYDPAFIHRYWDLTSGKGVDAFLSRYRPDFAVLSDHSVLIPVLRSRAWTVVLRDHGWVTLAPPPPS